MSDKPFPHLSEPARAMLAEPPEKRIEYIKRARWIPYPVANSAEQKLAELMHHSKVERMPCALIVGESNNGKSSLLTRFCKKHPPVEVAGGHKLQVPVLGVSAPNYANEQQLLLNIVKGFGVPYNPNDKPSKLVDQVLRNLQEYQCRLLLLDEFNLVGTGTISDQRKVLNRVRLISKDAQISVVAAGTRQALPLLAHEPQFANRFEPIPLKKWKVQDEDTLDLLATIENDLPFPEPSNLDELKFAQALVDAAEGTIGGMLEVIATMASYAIRKGSPRLLETTIQSSGWIPYSKRRQIADGQL